MMRWVLLVALAITPGRALAQDFAVPNRHAAAPALTLLEYGLPNALDWSLESAWIGRHALPELSTRALALAVGAGAWTGALGVSQTGERDLGWSSVGAAAGVSSQVGGVAWRGVVRREPHGPSSVLGRGLGVEAGGGAWVSPRRALTLWASAPQLWTRGAPAPLRRALELGVSWRGPGLELWLARQAIHRVHGRGHHDAGLAITSGTWRLWFQARNEPLRGGLGIAAAVRRLQVAALIENHPVLGESIRLSLSVARGPWP